MLQHLLGTVLTAMFAKLMGRSISSPAFDHKLVVLGAAVCNVVGNLAANLAFVMIPTSGAHIVESCQPLVTFALMVSMYEKCGSLDLYTFFSVSITVFGVCAFPIYARTSINTFGLVAAVISMIAFSVRNVHLKKLGTVWNDPVQKFAAVSAVSVLLVLPVWLTKAAISPTVITTGILGPIAAGLFYPMYSIASFKVLESVVSPVTHAILATMVRSVFYIETNDYPLCLSFNNVWNILVSIVVILIGIYLYQQQKLKFFWLVLAPAVLLVACLSKHCQPYGEFVQFHQNRNQVQVSIAWVYERQIPLSNLQRLAGQNQDLTIHVYCRTSQCIRDVAEQNEPNVAVELAVMSDIVKNTPLEEWLGSLNSLAGDEFENHLQEVTALCILWKYGGLYISPTVINTQQLPLNLTVGSAWVGKEVKRPDNRLPSELDVVYFPFQDPFLHKLLSVYADVYPKQRNLHFSFHDMVWRAVQARYGTRIPYPVRKNMNEYFSERPAISSTSYETGLHTTTSMSSPTNVPGISVSQHSIPQTTEVGSQFNMQLLPFLDIFVQSNHNRIITLFDSAWGTSMENWPPPINVTPIMVSVHVDSRTEKMWGENINYFRARGPIGCRDSKTLTFMKKRGIKAFISGSLIFLLDSPKIIRREGILVDLPKENAELLPKDIQNRAIHVETMEGMSSSLQLQQVLQLVADFGSADLVITQHIRHAMMCAALRTPVIFVSSTGEDKLETGTTQLFHTIDLEYLNEEQAKLWLANFSWSDIPPNPNLGTMMRYRTTLWDVLRQNRDFLEAAQRFSVVPMSPLEAAQQEQDLLFHLIFTTSRNSPMKTFTGYRLTGEFNWRHMRSVESILYHHPTSRIILHSNTLSQDVFDVLTEVGYSITVQKYDLKQMLKGSPAEYFISQLDGVRGGSNWYSHETDLIRLLVIYSYGGVYLDTDVVLVRPLTSLPVNTLGFQNKQNSSVNGAVMIFEKNNMYIKACLDHFAHHYSKSWAANGPNLLTKLWGQFLTKKDDQVHVMTYQYFYPIPWKVVMEQAFEQTSGKDFEQNMRILKSEAYAVHLNSKITGHIGWGESRVKSGSIASYVLNSYCILCDRIY